MELHTPNNNGQNPANPNNNETHQTHEPQPTFEDFDSTCSTPYVSAPSSPGRGPGPGPINGGFFYSCPASPMHFAITTTKASKSSSSSSSHSPDNSVPLGFEFEFSARLGLPESGQPGSMSSADELFLNGQIRPMKLSTHLEKPQVLAPLMDLENEDEDYEDKNEGRSRGRDLKLRDKSLRRRTRSMSPLRRASYEWNDHEEENIKEDSGGARDVTKDMDKNEDDNTRETVTSSVSASSSRSSSAGRSSKRWDFLKDFLYRSKSEGRRSNNKFWSTISFSPAKEKKPTNTTSVQASMSKEKLNNVSGKKPVNGVGKRRAPPSPHELHYTAYKAQAEEMKKKTFLPYRQGLLGCLGFSSKGYGAMNGFARALNPVSSR